MRFLLVGNDYYYPECIAHVSMQNANAGPGGGTNCRIQFNQRTCPGEGPRITTNRTETDQVRREWPSILQGYSGGVPAAMAVAAPAAATGAAGPSPAGPQATTRKRTRAARSTQGAGTKTRAAGAGGGGVNS